MGPKNYMPDLKIIAWAYVVTALLYIVAGGPPVLGVLYLMMTFFAGLVIFQNSEKSKQVAISYVMVAFLVLNAVSMAFGGHGRPPLPENLAVGMWIVNKLLYVFGLALFVPPLVEPWVKKNDRRPTKAIIAAFSMQFLLVMFMAYERQHDSREAIGCESIVGMMCTPKRMPYEPWYTSATAMEDLMFGLQVALLMAAFSWKKEEPALEETKKD